MYDHNIDISEMICSGTMIVNLNSDSEIVRFA